MSDVANARTAVVDYLRETATYRSNLADEHDEHGSTKNASYAESLEVMAKYVESLPDTDNRLILLADCEHLFEGDVIG